MLLFMKRNMWDHADTSAVIEVIACKEWTLSQKKTMACPCPLLMCLSHTHLMRPPQHNEERSCKNTPVASVGLLPHQLQVHDAIENSHTGIAVLSGAGGAGLRTCWRTWLTHSATVAKELLHHDRQWKHSPHSKRKRRHKAICDS